jgi:hypothetical protein
MTDKLTDEAIAANLLEWADSIDGEGDDLRPLLRLAAEALADRLAQIKSAVDGAAKFADRAATLTARVAELEALLAKSMRVYHMIMLCGQDECGDSENGATRLRNLIDGVITLRRDQDTLIARVAELEGALKPFAELADYYGGGYADYDSALVAVKHLRRARTALGRDGA